MALSANEGHLYPLEKQFIFIHKPAVLIRFDEIESVEFQRYAGGQGSTRNFDLSVTLLNTPGDTLAVKEYTFSGIDKSNYASLYSFLSQKKIRIKNIDGVGSEEPSGRVPMYDEMDDGGEEMGESSEDEDYDQNKASESESISDDDSENESDLGSLSDDSDLAEHRKAAKASPKKEKSKSKESTSKKSKESSKKRKQDGDKKSRSKKAKKDPNAPKRVSEHQTDDLPMLQSIQYFSLAVQPKTAFTFFASEKRSAIQKANPNAAFGEIVSLSDALCLDSTNDTLTYYYDDAVEIGRKRFQGAQLRGNC
jgi:structure-specific recognition protein 1